MIFRAQEDGCTKTATVAESRRSASSDLVLMRGETPGGEDSDEEKGGGTG
jgi:hypothetical protein